MCQNSVLGLIEENYSSDRIQKMIMATTNALQTKMFFRDVNRGRELLADIIRMQI